MKSLLGLGAVLAALPLAGCTSTSACADLECSDAANVTLTDLATQLAADLPITVSVCLADACTSFRIDHTGEAPICTALTTGAGLCTIDGEGNVVLTALPLPTGTTTGASIAVHATATSTKSGSLFDQTQMAALTGWPPTCPGECHHVQATFSGSP